MVVLAGAEDTQRNTALVNTKQRIALQLRLRPYYIETQWQPHPL